MFPENGNIDPGGSGRGSIGQRTLARSICRMKKSSRKSDIPPENRRNFLKTIGIAAAGGVAAGALPTTASGASDRKQRTAPSAGSSRADEAYQIRVDAALAQRNRPPAAHPVNGDESRYPDRIGSFSKVLPHNADGEVDPAAYNAFLAAIASGAASDYDSIPIGGTRRLVNPQAAVSYVLEGCDSHSLTMPPPPAVASLEAASEILEVYWQAVLRDLHFSEYSSNQTVGQAVRELRRYPLFRTVTPNSLFRGNTPGDLAGPYLSQFLLKPISFGAVNIDQKLTVPNPGDDYMVQYPDWLDVQNGSEPAASTNLDPIRRYIRNGRDLGEYVHLDTPSQSYYGAALIMLGWGANALSDTNPYGTSTNQEAFVQFGAPHIIDMVTKAAVAALKCAWYQKWNVHRRLRPEAFGGIIHNQLTGATSYPVKVLIGGSRALETVFSDNGTYLLPMAYPEGSPAHPAYPAGHATVAGACATMLKAFFNEDFVIPNPVVASADGLSLVNYSGAQLTIGGEVNKLAANISLGRDFAGVHWRSDGIEGMRLGEEVAVQLLRDYADTYSENFSGFSFTRFDGRTVTV